MSRRRRGSGPGIVTIYWRDIPAQITVTTAAGETEKVLLEPRFQHAIDRAAHVAGLTDTQDYVEQWRRVSGAIEGDPTELAQATADAIHSDYHRDRLEALVAAGGLEPDGGREP
jgi:hypothetical protein